MNAYKKKSPIRQVKAFLRALTFYAYNSFVSHVPVYWMRHWYLRHILKVAIGPHSTVHMGCFFTGLNIRIGHDTVINRNSYLDGRGGLSIGSSVAISPESYILSLDHDPNASTFDAFPAPVVIEDLVWIGARAMVLPGKTLGKGCVVGAGSVVTKDVDEFSIVAGVPAKIIGQRSRNLDYSPHYAPYFNTDIIP
jgi:acetyltransferase-like isoleucine patch superfamily enzyme